MSEWKKYRLGDLGTFFGGVTTIKRDDYGFGTPFITYKNVYKNSRIDTSILERMNVKRNDIIKRNCIYGDIFFTASSETPDEVAMSSVLLDNISDLTFNGFCKRFRLHNFNTLIPEYARYLLRGEEFRNSAYEYANGDVRFNISQESLSKISINIPDLSTQTAIAEILSSLDDKIELNNKINQELENLAQTLFKQWFIDFEFPNENLEPYKSSGGEMVESELGTIPKGWEVGTFGDLCAIRNGYAFRSKDFQEDGRNGILKIRNVNGSIIDIENTQFVEDSVINVLKEKFRVTSGNILVAMTGAEVGKIGIVPQTNKSLWLNQRVGRLIPKIEKSDVFVHTMFNVLNMTSNIRNLAMGSAQPNISSSGIESIKCLVPSKDLILNFIESNSEGFYLIQKNLNENQQLANLRDTILPKLISGELEVSQTQTIA